MIVRENVIRRADGSEGDFGIVEKPDFSLVVPFENGDLYLVQQFRYPVHGRFWEFPQGSWEDQPDADPLDVARGELSEETGLTAGSLDYLGHLYTAYGYSSQRLHLFLATELVQGRQRLENEEQDLVVGRFPTGAFHGMLKRGEIRDQSTVAAYWLFEQALSGGYGR